MDYSSIYALKRIPVHVTIKEFIIYFEYLTVKGYHRETKMRIKNFTKDEASKAFKEWADKQRTMCNVSILHIEEIVGNEQIIEV